MRAGHAAHRCPLAASTAPSCPPPQPPFNTGIICLLARPHSHPKFTPDLFMMLCYKYVRHSQIVQERGAVQRPVEAECAEEAIGTRKVQMKGNVGAEQQGEFRETKRIVCTQGCEQEAGIGLEGRLRAGSAQAAGRQGEEKGIAASRPARQAAVKASVMTDVARRVSVGGTRRGSRR